MARSQKPVVVKLNEEQIKALDLFVELGEFNGRSHALREMCLPILEAAMEVAGGKSTIKSAIKMTKAMHHLNKRMQAVAKNAKTRENETMFPVETGEFPTELCVEQA